MQGMVSYYNNYSPVGDVLVFAICIMILILVKVAYISKTTNFMLFKAMVATVWLAAISSVAFHMSLNALDKVPAVLPSILYVVHYSLLFMNLFLYVGYITFIFNLERRWERRYLIVAGIGFVGIVAFEILEVVTGYGFHITQTKEVYRGLTIFPYVYIFFMGIIAFVVFRYRRRVYTQVVYGVVGTAILSFVMLMVQGMHKQTSFTTAAFTFPIIAFLYLVHSNPYDIEIGAVNVGGFNDTIEYAKKHGKELLIMSLFMHEFEGTGRKYPAQVRQTIHLFTEKFFKNAVLFQITSGRMVLVAETKKNPNYEKISWRMIRAFEKEYPKYGFDYKIVMAKTDEKLNENNDYISLMRFVESSFSQNTVYTIEKRDIENYFRQHYILSELEDIYRKKDLNDERVKVYCQPVYNIRTESYDTAEALMRMELPEIGMVFPDQFIPLAESHGLIHMLSLIILHKTCNKIKKFMASDLNINRISVNFSVQELRDPSFCADVSKVIKESGIPYEKIAIEITESQNENDFIMVKRRINKLRDQGIKFYLDDFGTGYSNIERIMELPFDIIKFDRSLVIACGTDEKSEKMVTHLARMFSSMDYSVLYEGIENDQDEEKCKRMSARYLQGYKYSRPIPIEALTDYLDKTA